MIRILTGDCLDVLRTLPDASVHMCCTSPPYYGLRDYGCEGQIGLEDTPDAYVAKLVAVFREVRRVLKDDGTLWLNIGDSYVSTPAGKTKDDPFRTSGLMGGLATSRIANSASRAAPKSTAGLKPKDLIGIPWMLAFALRADGWYLRQDIIWHKPNPMPESVRDRCTKAHEYVFLLSKQARYFWDAEAVCEKADPSTQRSKPVNATEAMGNTGGNKRTDFEKNRHTVEVRNRRSVWTIATQPFAEAHFATFPPELAETCIKAGCPQGGTVLDCFAGAGTTGLVADRLQRGAVLIELNPGYAEMSRRRVADDAGLFAEMMT